MAIHILAMVLGLLVFVGIGMVEDPRRPLYPRGLVIGVFGRMGAGKTLYSTEVARRYLAAGYTVWANYPIDFTALGLPEVEVITSWGEMVDLSGGLVLVDEAHLWAPSWDQKALTLGDRMLISQLRKRSLDLMVVSQHPARIAKTLRELLTDVIYTQAYRWGIFFVKTFDPDELGGSMTRVGKTSAKPMRIRLTRINSIVAAAYQTMGTVAVSSALVDRVDKRPAGGSDTDDSE